MSMSSRQKISRIYVRRCQCKVVCGGNKFSLLSFPTLCPLFHFYSNYIYFILYISLYFLLIYKSSPFQGHRITFILHCSHWFILSTSAYPPFPIHLPFFLQRSRFLQNNDKYQPDSMAYNSDDHNLQIILISRNIRISEAHVQFLQVRLTFII
jgi:hypothetical protein